MFQKNEYVFYESGGICKIADIQISPLEHMPPNTEYYVMQSLHDSNGVMYIPVNSEQVFLRRLLNREEAERLLGQIVTVEPIAECNAKQLRSKFIDAMRAHEPIEWVRVIKTVYQRKSNPERRTQRLSETERSFDANAKRYLCTELAIALGQSADEMESFITDYIKKMA